MDLIAGNYSDSSSGASDNDSEFEDVVRDEKCESSETIPLPDFELDASGKGKSKDAIDPKVFIVNK